MVPAFKGCTVQREMGYECNSDGNSIGFQRDRGPKGFEGEEDSKSPAAIDSE